MIKRTPTATFAAAVLSVTLTLSLVSCGGGDSGEGDDTLVYWASNQGSSLQEDRKILRPELKKFEQKTGINVKLEVISWDHLLNRILTATSSGQGPDVLNIGNTWAASLQATGAFLEFDQETLKKIGGKKKFLDTSFQATGAPGQPPTSVPLYGLAYGLFYNKQMFEEAGIEEPPKTWEEFIKVGEKLTRDTDGDGKPDQWGLAVEGASYTENAHHAFILSKQHGGRLFQGGQPNFDSPKVVAAVKQYVDFMARHQIAAPSNAEYSETTQPLGDFAEDKAAMVLWQANARSTLETLGMDTDEYGVVPIPMPATLPPGGKRVNSHVAGINLSVFANTDNREGALKLVKFLTSKDEQVILNNKFGSLPVVQGAYQDPRLEQPFLDVFQQVLANTAAPLPQIPQESQFETLVGTAMKEMFADAAVGKPITEEYVRRKLREADQKMESRT